MCVHQPRLLTQHSRTAAAAGAGGAAGLVASSSSRLPAVPWASGAVFSTPSAAASSSSSSRCRPRRRGTGGSSTARRRLLLQRQSKQSVQLLSLESGECRTHTRLCGCGEGFTFDTCRVHSLPSRDAAGHTAQRHQPACLLSLHHCCAPLPTLPLITLFSHPRAP